MRPSFLSPRTHPLALLGLIAAAGPLLSSSVLAADSASDATQDANLSASIEPVSVQGCIAAHTFAQELRNQGALLGSREQLLLCSRKECPGPVRAECLRFMDALRAQMPSVIFRVTVDGTVESEVTAYLDGRMLFTELPTRALELDPGKYRLRVEHGALTPIERELLVFEGEHLVPITVAFVSPSGVSTAELPVASAPVVAPVAPAGSVAPVPWTVYALGGLGGAGLAGFVTFGIATRMKEKDLNTSCSPACSQSEIDGVRAMATVADTSLVVGGTALVAAAVFYFVRPTESIRVGAVFTPSRGMQSSVRVEF